ncbi:MAG: PepSY domain-containing protein [Muribaculaceae bacterium]|nr:PepSY domain-containing protein [Muribaculaceae bacterium]
MKQENSLGSQRKSRRCSIFLCSILMGCLLAVTACANKNPQTSQAGEGSQPVQDTTATAVQENESQSVQDTASTAVQENVSQPVQDTADTAVQGNESQSVQTTGDAAIQGSAAQTDIGVEQAKSTALSHAGLEASEVTFTKEKLDYDDGRAEYEIEFVTTDQKYEYEIKADDGAILNASVEAIERRISNMGTQGSVTLEEAKEIALEHAGLDASQVSYTKLEQDVEDGHTEYEIEFYADGKEYEYTIHGETGKILEAETELR